MNSGFTSNEDFRRRAIDRGPDQGLGLPLAHMHVRATGTSTASLGPGGWGALIRCRIP
jgi:hypothetical protein